MFWSEARSPCSFRFGAVGQAGVIVEEKLGLFLAIVVVTWSSLSNVDCRNVRNHISEIQKCG